MTMSDTHAAYGAAHLRYLSKPGRSVLMNAECLWCHKMMVFDEALPSTRPERIDPVKLIMSARHWHECDRLQFCRRERVDPEFGEHHRRKCWQCRGVPPMDFWPVESGSGRPVVEIVDGKRSRVRQIARRRGTAGGRP